MTEVEIAYLAGIFEGEGSVSVGTVYRGKQHDTLQLIVRVGMSDADVIIRLQQITGVGTISSYQPNRAGSKMCYRWSVTNRDECDTVLAAIWPYLGVRRREQIRVAFKKITDNLTAKGQVWQPRLLMGKWG